MPNEMGIWDQVRMLNDIMPLIGFGQRFLSESDTQKRALVVGDAAEWLASKTSTTLDDQVIGKLVAVLKTPEGEDLLRTLVAIGEAFVSAQPEVKP